MERENAPIIFNFNLNSFCPLEAITERQNCSECGRKRMYFCYDCKIYVGSVGSMAPRVELPLRVDIVKHRHELNSKSTAIHALLISPTQTRMFDKFEEVPNYALEAPNSENVAVLFPSKNSLSIEQFVRENGPIRRIVVLDSTWNTVGQLKNIPNLAKLPWVHLRRHTTDYWRPQNGLSPDHLATIEAIYYACLECRETETNWGNKMKRERLGGGGGRDNETEEEPRGEDKNGRKKDDDDLDNLLFWFYFFRNMVMRPDPSQLRRYQLSPRNGPVGALGSIHCVRRQWRFLLLLVALLSVTFTFGFWTFQSDGSVSPPYNKLEQFVSIGDAFANSSTRKNVTDGAITAIQSSTASIGISESHSSNKIRFFGGTSTAKALETNFLKNATETANASQIFANPPRQSNNSFLSICADPPPGLVGPIPVWMDEPGFNELSKLYPRVRTGGHNWPDKCTARHRVAIIVPYRDRETHLRIFLHNLHFLLTKQQLDYAIFVVEQTNNQTFNRGKLMNVGFVEASLLYDWQCFIFHDVDLLPEDDRNLYSCPEHPRHMSAAVDKFKYVLPYAQIFGGATAMTREQFARMNGFSNDYWGWGGEDDDIANRISYAGYKISRYPKIIARYKMIKHEQERMNPANDCRWDILGKTKQRWRHDGLSSLNYTVLTTTFHQLYTNIVVDLLERDSRSALAVEHISQKARKGC
ncbi:hypothetical protein GPALN_011250 [Globodera pallida]|nr:hypothetical protein GPALN_011250 [Globodera pallida]